MVPDPTNPVAGVGRNQDAVLVSPASIPLTFLDLISVCTYQYAELGLFFTMPFVEIRIILVLRLSFAVSKTDEILSLGAGDQVVGRSVLLRCPLAPFPAQLLVHFHFHDLLDDIPEHFLHGFHDVSGAGEVLALNILLQ